MRNQARPAASLGAFRPGGALLPDVLVICSANVARSPLLAGLLQSSADDRLGREVVTVNSAGTDARFGSPAAEHSARIAARWRLSLHNHHSRPLMTVPVDDVALVLTMSRVQRRSAERSHPQVADRTFLLRELVEILQELRQQGDGRLRWLPSALEDPRKRLEAVVRLAAESRPERLSRRHDVPDPLGGDIVIYEAIAEEFASAGKLLASVLFGPERS